MILYVLFLFFIGLFAIMPFWMIYGFSNFAYFVLYKVFGYRKKVVFSNLEKAFPNKSKEEIKSIAIKFYKNLTDIIIEGIKGFSIGRKTVAKRHKILNPEVLEEFFNKNQSVIGVTGHIGNWEWGSLSAGFQIKHKAIAFYKPLSNKYINKFLKNTRTKCGTHLASIYETHQTFETFANECCAYILVADQNPGNKEKAIWTDFLGIDTAFLHGPEKYAKFYNYPIVFIDIKRVKRGYYELRLSTLIENLSLCTEGEITQKYAQRLQQAIEETPHSWLWSHKRWKYKR